MSTLNVSTRGAIRIIEMNRPKALNALNPEMADDLADAFLDAASDEAVKVAVLTGAGRAFSAGADLNADRNYPSRHGPQGLVTALIDFPKPLIAAVNGLGVGYGATVCGLSDIVIMSDQARLRAPFSALGLTAELASTVTFPRLMGRQRASWFLLASEWLSAEECLEWGVAMELVDPSDVVARALEQAEKLAALPLVSLLKTKQLMVDPIREQMKAAMLAENRGLAELRGGPANKEAIAAFREKRQPDFSS